MRYLYAIGIQEFDPFLGAYPLLPPDSTYPAWVKISNHIQKNTIDRVFVDRGFVNSHDDQLEDELSRAAKIIQRQEEDAKQEKDKEASSSHQGQASRKTTTIAEEDEEEMEIETSIASEPTSAQKEQLVTFTLINLRSSFRKGAVGEEVTRYSMDKSWLLNNLFTTVYRSGTLIFFRLAMIHVANIRSFTNQRLCLSV